MQASAPLSPASGALVSTQMAEFLNLGDARDCFAAVGEAASRTISPDGSVAFACSPGVGGGGGELAQQQLVLRRNSGRLALFEQRAGALASVGGTVARGRTRAGRSLPSPFFA